MAALEAVSNYRRLTEQRSSGERGACYVDKSWRAGTQLQAQPTPTTRWLKSECTVVNSRHCAWDGA